MITTATASLFSTVNKMAIDRLTLKDTVTAATYFAINVNGQDYRAAAQTGKQDYPGCKQG